MPTVVVPNPMAVGSAAIARTRHAIGGARLLFASWGRLTGGCTALRTLTARPALAAARPVQRLGARRFVQENRIDPA